MTTALADLCHVELTQSFAGSVYAGHDHATIEPCEPPDYQIRMNTFHDQGPVENNVLCSHGYFTTVAAARAALREIRKTSLSLSISYQPKRT